MLIIGEVRMIYCIPKNVVRKLGSGIEPLANQVMTVLLTLIQSIKTSTVLEDAFLVVGAMAAGA